jgi:hypothetical protein
MKTGITVQETLRLSQKSEKPRWEGFFMYTAEIVS